MFNKSLLACPILFLSACGGGSSTTPKVVPIATSGFAKASDAAATDADFRLADATRVIRKDGIYSFEKQDIRISGNPSDNELTVVLDGTTYVLPQTSATSFRTTDGPDYTELAFFAETAFVSGAELIEFIDGDVNRSLIAFGFDTDPDTISKAVGTGTFTGSTLATLLNGPDTAFGSGQFLLSADFEKGTISGIATIEDDRFSIATFTFDPITIAMEATDIQGNGFQGNISVSDGDIGGTLNGAVYDGRFYGPQAEDIAGQITGQIDLDDNVDDTFVEAIFIGSQPDE